MSLLHKRHSHGGPGTGGGGYSTQPINLVLEGDSITSGGAGGIPAGQAYGETALADAALSGWDITLAANKAAAFSTMTEVNSRAAAVDALIDPAKRNVLSLLIGTNDLFSSGTTAAALFSSVKTYCQARTAAGFGGIVLCTLTSRDSVGPSASDTFNALLRADTSFYTALVDFFDNSLIGGWVAAKNTTYFPDNIHPSPTARSVMVPLWISGFRVAAGQVGYPALASITVTSPEISAGVGGTQRFVAKGFDANSIPVPTGTVVWASSDPSVATINSSTGVLTGVSAGTVTVTATVGAVSGNTSATVVAVSNAGNVPSRHLWMRAEAETVAYADNALVLKMTDQISTFGTNSVTGLSNGRHAFGQGNASPRYKPAIINGKAVYRFDGSGYALFSDILSGLTQGELLFVGQYNYLGMAWLFGTSGQSDLIGLSGNAQDSFGSTTRHSAVLGVAEYETFIYNVISTPSEFTINVNGVQKFTTATNTVGFPSLPKLGLNVGGNAAYFDLGDLFISTAKLSGADRTLVYNEMKTFYGL